MNRLLLILCAFVAGCLLCGSASAQCGPVRKAVAKTACVAKKTGCFTVSRLEGAVHVGLHANRRVLSLASRGSRQVFGVLAFRDQCDSVRFDCANDFGSVLANGHQGLLADSQFAADKPAAVGPKPVSVVERQRSRTVIRRSVLNCVNGNCQQ